MKINTSSKNFRIILFSVVGLIVLGAVVLLLTVTAPDSGEEENTAVSSTTEDPALVLQPEDMGDIASIHIENSKGSFTVKPVNSENGEKNWAVEGMEDIDERLWVQSSFESLVGTLTDMTARSVIEEAPDDLEQYGLTEPQARAEVNYENGGTFTILIGGNVVSGSANYVKTLDSDTVYSYYTYNLSGITGGEPMSFINTTVMPSYDSSNAPEIKKITVTRKDLDAPIVLEALPEAPEDSIQVYAYAFTSPYDVYLDLTEGNSYINAMFTLSADKAVYVDPTEAQMAETGLDDPFCEVDMLAGDSVYRLYIGSSVTEEVTDEESGVTTAELAGFYAMSNQVKDVIYYFSADKMIWATMEPTRYMSKLFLMPYIYDLNTVSYRDSDCEFSLTVEGGADDGRVILNGEESDIDRFKTFYQYLVSCRGEEIYTDEAKGDFIAEFSYTYDDGRDPDSVALYGSNDRKVVIEVNGKNIFKTKWNYGTRLKENAKAYLNGEEVILNY
ncbi:MAG: DUF4340 domain-containing protein [Bacteroides sp.]|nr:DUF4340 domain-containing protein [Bacteroides sp.]